jgi:spore coat polysaccharide biosynthesis predicted glycosyltransferase SpsG
VKVVVGPSNPHLARLQQAAAARPERFVLCRNVIDMPPLMAWADVAISGAGSTSWELAFMGAPVLSIVLAENQVEVARMLAVHGVGQNLGGQHALGDAVLCDALVTLLCDAAKRREMSDRGQRLIDGDGAARVRAAMREALVAETRR